ncbi:MAG: S41 family peptidase [Gemmatimonadales bacterium]
MRHRLGWLLIGVILGASGAIVVERWIALHRAGPVTTAGVFQDVMSAIRRSFVDSLSDDELYQKAAKGVVSSLGDPYSSFLAPTEAQNYRDNLRGTSASLGLSLRRGLTGYYVQSVVSGSTADQAGLAPGTYLLELNGKPTERQSPDHLRYALATLDGPAAVVVRRPGDSLTDSLTLTPEPTTYPAVSVALPIAPGIGYIAIRAISERASRELETALALLGAERLDGLVLDLRGNLGGRLDEALAIADLFLEAGQKIGSVAKRNEFPAVYSARSGSRYPRLEVAILVDHQTASAAEIVAAALRDNLQTRLLGERTLGKGLVQTTIPLGEGTAVRLTTGRWLSPNGTAIDGGLTPDLVVSPSPAARLAGHGAAGPIVAETLEAIARRRLTDTSAVARDSAVTGADLSALAGRLDAAGVRTSPAQLGELHGALELEARRLEALLRGRAETANRLGLLGDPVVAAGLASLERPADTTRPRAR